MLRSVAALAFVCAATVLAWPAGAGAVAPQAQGWWYRPQQAGTPVTIPAPPVVPGDGLYVAQGPNGENLAIAALEYPTSGGRDASLTLTLAPGAAGTVTVTACPASSGFTPASGGPWAEAPAYNCTAAAVDGRASEDGATVTFALTPEFLANSGAAMDVVLIPTPASAPFQAPVAKPGDGSFVPSLGAAPVDSPASEGGASSAGSDAFAGSDTLSSVPFPASAGGAIDLGTSSGAPAATAGGTGVRRAVPPTGVAGAGHDRYPLSDRLGAVTLLLLTGAALWFMGGRPRGRPRLLGASRAETADLRAEQVGGIGRFARPRTSAPTRL
jgi:hypothetical protein